MSGIETKPSFRRRLGSGIARLAHEPLAQFLAIALVLFSANQLIHGEEPQRSGDLITISQGRVEQIAASYRLLAGRMPSRAELQALVNDFADEEIDYREAIAMGLDADDTIVRRRMRQKLEFLAEDAQASTAPSDEQLATWRAAHADDYRIPPRISFRHVMASKDHYATNADAQTATWIERLRSGADPTTLGDASMLPSALPPTTQQGVAMLFGEKFASALFARPQRTWFGPVDSPLGAHAVLILAHEPARDPALAEIRDKLRSDWIEAQRRQQREEFQARLRKRYQVVVEWPQIYASQPVPTDVPRIVRPLDTIDSGAE